MPINNEERTKLELAVASFETQDSVAVARLLWETLSAARATPDNQGGLGPDQVFALGRLIYDKAEWPALAKVEEATGRRPIRFPLMRAVEGVFRAGLSNSLPKLPEEHRQALGAALSKMDPDELKLLTVLLYDTIISADFVVSDDAKVMHPLAKFLAPGWSWDQLKQMEPVVAGVCIPLVNSCHTYFREHFPTIFRAEEELAVSEAAPASEAPAPAPAAPVAAQPEVEAQPALSPDEEEAAATDEEGGVSDSDPFVAAESSTEASTDAAESTTDSTTAVEAQAEEDDTHVPVQEASAPPADDEPLPVPAVKDEPPAEPTPTNGHKLSKKERREMKRQQREEAGK